MSTVFENKGLQKINPIFRLLPVKGIIFITISLCSSILMISMISPLFAFSLEKAFPIPQNTNQVFTFERTGFDVLQKAQKNIQHDLGLPETPVINTNQPHGSPTETHPILAWSLLTIAAIGFFSFVLIVFKAQSKLSAYRQNVNIFRDGDTQENAAQNGFREFTLPNPSKALHLPEPLWLQPSNTSLSTEDEALLMANRLDFFLRSIRLNLGNLKEFFKISLYHYEETSGLFHLISDSTGTTFPLFFIPDFLGRSQAECWKKDLSALRKASRIPEAGEVLSVAFPFFDRLGTLFVFSVSSSGNNNIPSEWYDHFSIFIPELGKKLAEYSDLQYIPLTNTKNEEGELDFRALENRSLEEIQKGRELGNSFTLLFIKIVGITSERGNSLRLPEFFHRFKEKVRGTLRSADSMTILGDRLLMFLLPETDRVESQYVFNRILDLFHDLSRNGNLHEVRLFSNLLEWRSGSKEEIHDLIRRGVKFEIPFEG
ncbi:MAG: hypothetical protein ACYCYP_09955 [Leptospirales bacterium]